MGTVKQIRRPLDTERFHVLVIGGGINGVAIARECARLGRPTLLVEQDDFASGTTSRSTRIIHGGLRYLEQADVGLVRESLRERGRLLRERSHLISPMRFLLAFRRGGSRSALQVRAGLWLYRLLGGRLFNGSATAGEQKRLEHLLDAGQKWSVFNFEDAQCEFPERLVAEWVGEAADSGAVVRNHTQVLAVDVTGGRAKGALLRDELTGREERIQATWIINAAGPWVDRVCHRSRINPRKRMIGGVRGSHIVVPRFAGAPAAALLAEAIDRRPFFLIPWDGQLLVGTTEVLDQGDPSRVQPSPEEIDYLLRSLGNLFPRIRFTANDVRYAYAGIRPLPADSEATPGAISRRHILHDHKDDGAAQMISIIGGKLTTAAEVARQCAAKIGLGKEHLAPPVTSVIGEIDPLLDGWVARVADAGSISAESARAIVEWYGKRSVVIARMALSSANLRAPLCRHTPHIVAEAVDAFTHEYAATLGDVLLRRVPVAFSACWSQQCSRDAAMRIGAVMGWTESEIAAHLEALETERAAFLVRPAAKGVPLQAAAD
jgi:glycerol-3-phosphate dehydrogenase